MTSHIEHEQMGRTVDHLLALARLPLPAERRARLAQLFEGLAAAANDLSRRMAAAEHRAVAPLTGVHP